MWQTEWLIALREAARLGSLSAAGSTLHCTQSAVSRRIAALERATGELLLERLPRGVRLTPAGRLLLGHAEIALDRLASAEQDLHDARRLLGGRLRVGAFPTADAVLVPQAVAAFRQAHPRVHVTLTEAITPALEEAVGRGALDLAVTSHVVPPHPRDDLCVEPLAEDQYLVALPRGHRHASTTRPLPLADLADETWMEGDVQISNEVLAAACAAAGFTPRIDIRVREWTAKLGFAAAGLGATLVPALLAPGVRPDLVLRPLTGPTPRRTLALTLPPPSYRAPATAAFLGLLRTAVTRHGRLSTS